MDEVVAVKEREEKGGEEEEEHVMLNTQSGAQEEESEARSVKSASCVTTIVVSDICVGNTRVGGVDKVGVGRRPRVRVRVNVRASRGRVETLMVWRAKIKMRVDQLADCRGFEESIRMML